MSKKVRWGILGAAKIALVKVIPAMQKSEFCEISALASRDPGKASKAATELAIPVCYGSYEELLADPNIDAIYNPLPNHLHLPWTLRAAQAGKHVLCEKPIGMNSREVLELIQVRNLTGMKIAEAFMVRVHPQWRRAREIIRSGALGTLRVVQSFFSYNNQDPKNIRNIPEFGGGGLMDIGCYPIHISRFLFEDEPKRVLSLVERDPSMGIDRLTSAILDFPAGHATFTCSTQLIPYQKVEILGTKGRIEIEIPFNAPPDQEARIFINGVEESFRLCDQYTLQGDAFARAILGGSDVPVPLEDSLANAYVIDALFRSAETNRWETPG
jgi:predicted dehydrogenase